MQETQIMLDDFPRATTLWEGSVPTWSLNDRPQLNISMKVQPITGD